MLPNLPLDVDNKQLRIGDHVIYSFPDSCHMAQGRVAKMTDCFVWIVHVGFPDDYTRKIRREFRQVVKINS